MSAEGAKEDLELVLKELRSRVTQVRQLRLLTTSAFTDFARQRGVPLFDGSRSDVQKFKEKGWLLADEEDPDERTLYHPFRIYPAHKIMKYCDLRIATGAILNKSGARSRYARMIDEWEPTRINQASADWNLTAELGALMEPVYWPEVVGRRAHFDEWDSYREHLDSLISRLPLEEWHKRHESLRSDAHYLDGNRSLYVLLRLARWQERERLVGSVGGALWIRHLAEVIRRGFEHVHEVEWAEEDNWNGMSRPEGRKRFFGCARPFDERLKSRPFVIREYGFSPGPSVRWYVEGETEYYAIQSLIGDPALHGIELMNLRGSISNNRSNAAVRLEEWLAADKSFRRFSMISIDGDVAEGRRVVSRLEAEGHVIGKVHISDPDFEFHNFTIQELLEAFLKLEPRESGIRSAIQDSDWTAVCKIGQFEGKLKSLISGLRNFKGKKWGEALAEIAITPRPGSSVDRPIVQAVRDALFSLHFDYDLTVESIQRRMQETTPKSAQEKS